MEDIFEILNGSQIFTGAVMLMMNLGSRYIIEDISEEVTDIFKTPLFRIFFVFCIMFIATKNIKISILLTLCFIIIFKYLLHNKSKHCIIKNKNNKIIK
jgi:hypothetical protein